MFISLFCLTNTIGLCYYLITVSDPYKLQRLNDENLWHSNNRLWNVARGHIKSILSTSNTRLAAICSDNPEQAKALLEANGARCPVYTDLEKMLSNPEIDLVLVLTPNHLHARQAAMVAESGKIF